MTLNPVVRPEPCFGHQRSLFSALPSLKVEAKHAVIVRERMTELGRLLAAAETRRSRALAAGWAESSTCSAASIS